MSEYTILIADDHPLLRSAVVQSLRQSLPLAQVREVASAEALAEALDAHPDVDLVLLDLMLPRLDGMTLCQKLRQEFQNPVPILMLTARDPVEDRVQGLALGADDYLVKPFSLTELDARIKALVRRAQGRQVQSVLAWKDLQVDTRSPQAWRQGRCIALTPTSHKLLMCLVRAAPAVVRKQEMEYLVWGDEPPDSGALRTHIHELRLQVDRSFDTALITTVHSVGWRMQA